MAQYKLQSTAGKLILFATIMASGMAFLDGTIVNIAIPTIQDAFGATISQIQWIVNGYSLMVGALMLISGALGDRFGRRRIFSYGIVVFTLSSLLCSFASSVTQLILFRALQGVGAAMMTPGSLSIINSSFDHTVRGKAIGMWSGFSGGLAALGPFLGGYLVQNFGWPSIFYINLPLGIFTLFITLRYVPETKNDDARNIDLSGAVLIFLALFGIIYGLIQGPSSGWTSPVLASLLAGICFFVTFLVVEKKTKEPLLRFEIFKSRLVTGANLATLFLYFALSGVIFFLVLNLQQIQHLPPLLAGMALLPTILLITFLSGPGGSLADKIGPRIPMIVGPLLVAIGMALFILPGRFANYFTDFLPGLILFGFGMALVIAPLTKSALNVDERYSGIASGVNNAVSRIAGLLAIAILGGIVLSLFSVQLQQSLVTSSLTRSQQEQILNQKEKLGGIQIPKNFPQKAQEIARERVEDSFITGFRTAMGINAFLAFVSALIAYFFIHPQTKKR